MSSSNSGLNCIKVPIQKDKNVRKETIFKTFSLSDDERTV
jgi:hypothetical protein